MRGLIGAGGEEMEKEKEDLRVELLVKGLEHERIIDTHRSWMNLAATLQVNPHDGKIIGGPGFETKVESYYDFLEKLMPYVPVNRPQGAAAASPESENSDRNALVEDYKRMVASGEL